MNGTLCERQKDILEYNILTYPIVVEINHIIKLLVGSFGDLLYDLLIGAKVLQDKAIRLV